MGEAGGGLPGNPPSDPQLTGAGETSPPAFAAPYLQDLSRILFVFCFWRDPRGPSHPFQKAKLLPQDKVVGYLVVSIIAVIVVYWIITLLLTTIVFSVFGLGATTMLRGI